MMTANCPICRSAKLIACPYEAAHLRVPTGRQVFRCAPCTHAFLHPPYSRAETAGIYGDDYYDGFESTVGMAGDGPGGAAEHLRRRLERLEGLVAGRRLLDVGCGRGNFLAYAIGRGWTAKGIDVSDDAVRIARARHGLDAEAGEIDEFDFGPGRFDAIHANHVIEHIRDPLDALRRFRNWIAPDGVLVIEVPNEFGNLFFRLGRRVLPMSRMVRRDPSPHVHFFSPRSLRATFEAARFRVIELRTVRWQVGARRPAAVRAAMHAVAMLERALDCSGNIVAFARPAS